MRVGAEKLPTETEIFFFRDFVYKKHTRDENFDNSLVTPRKINLLLDYIKTCYQEKIDLAKELDRVEGVFKKGLGVFKMNNADEEYVWEQRANVWDFFTKVRKKSKTYQKITRNHKKD